MKISIQNLLPKKLLTYLISLCASWKGGLITYYMILFFIRIYKVNMQEAAEKNISNYLTFNSFFTRKLKKNVRPIDINSKKIIIPADGTIVQIGQINKTCIFKIKKHLYNLEELFAGYKKIINHFYNGKFITIYISPKDYHRIHMPCTGILREMLYIPGKLFSVNPKIIKKNPKIFFQNERLICIFKTKFGYMAQILIGAIIVGSIETTWLGPITPPHKKFIKHWKYKPQKENSKNKIILSKGQEMGLFKLGSTVISIFEDTNILLNTQLKTNDIVQIGMTLACKNDKKFN